MAEFLVIPERTALLNIDMQNCFVEAPDGPVLLNRINRLAATCRRAGILVIYASHVVRPDSKIGILGEIAPIVKQGIINKGTESAALHKDVVVDAPDVLLEKPRFGALRYRP